MLEYSELKETLPSIYEIKQDIARLEDMNPSNGLIIKDNKLYKSKNIEYNSDNKIYEILKFLESYTVTSNSYEKRILFNVLKCMTIDIYKPSNLSKNEICYDILEKRSLKGISDHEYTPLLKELHEKLYNRLKQFNSWYSDNIYYRNENLILFPKEIQLFKNNLNKYKDEIIDNEILPPEYKDITKEQSEFYKELSMKINKDTKLRIVNDTICLDTRKLKCFSRIFTRDNRWKILNYLKNKPQNKYIHDILQKLSEGVYKNDIKWKNMAMDINTTNKNN